MAKQVTCDSCRRSFLVPEEIGDYWVLCPYCEKVNPRAQEHMQKALPAKSTKSEKWTIYGVVGTLLLIAGLLGGILGTPLVLLGSVLGPALRRSEEARNYWYVMSGIWFVASVALFMAGTLLMRADARGSMAGFGWKALTVLLLALIAGVGGWVFVFETCKF